MFGGNTYGSDLASLDQYFSTLPCQQGLGGESRGREQTKQNPTQKLFQEAYVAHQVAGQPPLFCPPRVILERKELALLLSVVVSECASLEADITWLYATLMGKYLPHNQRKGPPHHPVGFLIFKAINSRNQRTQLIMDLAKLLGLEQKLMAELKSVTKLITSAFEKRNELAHAFWGTHDELYPEA